jgi:hypothetical protein
LAPAVRDATKNMARLLTYYPQKVCGDFDRGKEAQRC